MKEKEKIPLTRLASKAGEAGGGEDGGGNAFSTGRL